MTETQEIPAQSRTEKAAIALTPREKQALRFVSIHRETPESVLLRELLIGDIVTEYDRLLSALEKVAAPDGEAA
jgi:hypothetical protein